MKKFFAMLAAVSCTMALSATSYMCHLKVVINDVASEQDQVEVVVKMLELLVGIADYARNSRFAAGSAVKLGEMHYLIAFKGCRIPFAGVTVSASLRT